MTTNIDKLVWIFGVDYCFLETSETVLNNIASHLGGDSSVDVSNGIVTYMFSDFIAINQCDLPVLHELVRKHAENFSSKFECCFHYSELYLRASNEGAKNLFANQKDSMFLVKHNGQYIPVFVDRKDEANNDPEVDAA